MRNLPKKTTKRSLDEIDSPTTEELWYGITQMNEPYRSLSAFLYLFGNRISEVVGIPEEEKTRKGSPVWVVEPIKKFHIEINPEGTIMRVKTRTLKRKGRPEHKYFVRITTEEEQRYYRIVKDYINTKRPEEYLWNTSRYKAYKALYNATTVTDVHGKVLKRGLDLHKLRALRATRDAEYFELDALDLKTKFNWQDTKTPFIYAAKNPRNIENKLLKK